MQPGHTCPYCNNIVNRSRITSHFRMHHGGRQQRTRLQNPPLPRRNVPQNPPLTRRRETVPTRVSQRQRSPNSNVNLLGNILSDMIRTGSREEPVVGNPTTETNIDLELFDNVYLNIRQTIQIPMRALLQTIVGSNTNSESKLADEITQMVRITIDARDGIQLTTGPLQETSYSRSLSEMNNNHEPNQTVSSWMPNVPEGSQRTEDSEFPSFGDQRSPTTRRADNDGELSTSQEYKTENTDNTCIMCILPCDCILLPCMHNSSCQDCLLSWWKTSYHYPNCPVCRVEVREIKNNVGDDFSSLLLDWENWRIRSLGGRHIQTAFNRWVSHTRS